MLLIGAAWFVDVNTFSLHGVYGNRLVRAYPESSRPYNAKERSRSPAPQPGERQPDPVTEFDPNDDLKLTALQVKAKSYDGPYLIVNTALNLVHGDRLDWQERKAESFILTPLYCGSEDTGYRPTAEYASPGGMSLGTAVTLSGAAASPNMGYHSSPAVTALLTVFNARLGAWLGQSGQPDALAFEWPSVWLCPSLPGVVRLDAGRRPLCLPVRRRPLREPWGLRTDPPPLPVRHRVGRRSGSGAHLRGSSAI